MQTRTCQLFNCCKTRFSQRGEVYVGLRKFWMITHSLFTFWKTTCPYSSQWKNLKQCLNPTSFIRATWFHFGAVCSILLQKRYEWRRNRRSCLCVPGRNQNQGKGKYLVKQFNLTPVTNPCTKNNLATDVHKFSNELTGMWCSSEVLWKLNTEWSVSGFYIN